jgi:hypothetical protein
LGNILFFEEQKEKQKKKPNHPKKKNRYGKFLKTRSLNGFALGEAHSVNSRRRRIRAI